VGNMYFSFVDIFKLLQAAGPVLTPLNVGVGARALPAAGGPTEALGTWSWATQHEATLDAREIYWDGGAKHYIETYGGRRFQSGQWPTEAPPIYPGQ